MVMIFVTERFFRGTEARSKNPDGSGLGLAIAHSIVTAHRGKIWAEIPKENFLSIHVSMP